MVCARCKNSGFNLDPVLNRKSGTQTIILWYIMKRSFFYSIISRPKWIILMRFSNTKHIFHQFCTNTFLPILYQKWPTLSVLYLFCSMVLPTCWNFCWATMVYRACNFNCFQYFNLSFFTRILSCLSSCNL